MSKTDENVFGAYQQDAKTSPVTLGALARSRYLEDAKLLPIYLSRYKFVSKMISTNDEVLEVGCADGFAGRIVAQVASYLDYSDVNHDLIDDCAQRNPNSQCFIHNFCESPTDKKYDVIYSLDVIEHIPAELTKSFIHNIGKSLKSGGAMIVGTPSLESQKWASEGSLKEHINCRTQEGWKEALSEAYDRVFPFSMNDEVVHTGFGPMSHYLIFICTNYHNT
jgi:2-polyprenyl-3-methyl-5-hydroxy-6-metoxy-1,4-benzoquinol methylase